MQKHNEWLLFAKDDLTAAHILFDHNLIKIASYHTQQTVEKGLKSFLIFKNQLFKKTHDLALLTRLCIAHDPTFETLSETSTELNPYFLEGRYPQEGNEVTSSAQIKLAINRAEEALAFIAQKLK